MAVVWFLCLGGLGIFMPYYSLYLHENAALPGSQVGGVLAVVPLAGILAQPLWGQIADVTGGRARLIAVLGLGAGVGYAALALASGFTALLLQTAALALFSTAIVPSCVSVTLALSQRAGPRAFGLSRVWGTVGFLFFVVGFPLLLHRWQALHGLAPDPGSAVSQPGLEIMFPLTGAVVAAGGLVALALPRRGAVALRAPRGDWRLLLRHGPYLRLLAFALLAYALLQGPMALFPVFVRSLGGSVDSVSHMWVLMLLLEIPLIALTGASLERLGPRGLLAAGVLAGGARWSLCGFAPDLRWVYPVQILHGVVVAGLIVGAALYVDAVVPERLRSTGQGLLAMVGVSVGGISSNLAAGWLLEHVDPAAPYRVGGLGALALGLALPLLLPPPRRPEARPPDAAQASALRR
jgi:PPP family 3-phenylpropionic acid transporter